MSARQDAPFPIQPRANGAMARVLRFAAGAALVLGALGVLLPGRAGVLVAWSAVAVVIAIPLLRIGWLGCRWVLRRDLAFASLAFGLLAVVLASALLAVLQGR